MFWKWKKKRVVETNFKCSCCGEFHNVWPALTYNSPIHYFMLSRQEKDTIAELTSDFCIIERESQIDRFIRVVLYQKVVNYHVPLEYGLWVSLSEKSLFEL